jgi:uncharacterized damage-inducible protein DinB
MDAKTIQPLFAYNRWANARILDAAAKLTEEQFTRDLHSSHGSVRGTLVHMISGDWIWLTRWQGSSPKAMLDPAEFPTFAALRARWTAIEREQAEFVAKVTDESLRQEIRYVNLRGEPHAYLLWQMMQHIANHSTFHRGQVVTILRQLGAVPPSTDFLVFYDMK